MQPVHVLNAAFDFEGGKNLFGVPLWFAEGRESSATHKNVDFGRRVSHTLSGLVAAQNARKMAQVQKSDLLCIHEFATNRGELFEFTLPNPRSVFMRLKLS